MDITINSIAIPDFQPANVSSVELRFYVDQAFAPSGSTAVIQRSGPGLETFYKKYTCPVGGGVLSIPQVVLPATLDATPATARYRAVFVGAGVQQFFSGFASFFVPASPTTTDWATLLGLNASSAPPAASGEGFVVQVSPFTLAYREILGTSDHIVVTNGDGQAGNPTLNIGDDVVTLDGSQTLTNKTLTGAILKGYPRTIEVNTTTVGNVGGGTDPLHSFSLPAGSLATNGDYLKVRYGGVFAANNNNKTISVSFGGAGVASVTFDVNGAGWVFDVTYTRTSATTVRAIYSAVWGSVNRNSAGTSGGNGVVFSVNPAADLTVSDLILNNTAMAVTCSGTSDNDISQTLSIVELIQR